jgi:lambda repressor-like predicted transcriptional regulator
VIWGFAASRAGVSYTLLGAAVLFLGSLLLAARLFDRPFTQRAIIIASYTAGINPSTTWPPQYNRHQ